MAKNIQSIEKDIQATAQKLTRLKNEKAKMENKVFLEIGKIYVAQSRQKDPNLTPEEILKELKTNQPSKADLAKTHQEEHDQMDNSSHFDKHPHN